MIKQKLFYSLSLIGLLIALSSCAQTRKSTSKMSAVFVETQAEVYPLLKGWEQNPFMRLDIYVPEGGSLSVSKFQFSLNAEALSDIEGIKIFNTGKEPAFSDKNLLVTANPALKMEVPLTLSLSPGWNYCWVSVQLNGEANMDHLAEIHLRSLVDAGGKSYPIHENGKGYSRRIGIALRKKGEDGVNTYRIPGICATDKSTLIAVYDVRYDNSRDLPANIDVGMSRSTDGGKTWEPMKIIMDMGAPADNSGIGDPAVLFDPVSKKIWVAALWSKGNRSIAGSGPGLSPDETGQFVLVSSADDGQSWSAPQNITAEVKDPKWHLFFQGPGNGIAMQNGTLVFPAQYWDEKGMPYSTLIFSTDHGMSWQGKREGPKSNTTESQLVETRAGTIMLNMRDNRGHFRSVATTDDLGKTWTEHISSYHSLPDPVCMASLIKAPVQSATGTADYLFFSNCNNQLARKDMTIKASADAGESWPAKWQLLIDERGSFGYSAQTGIDNHTIGLLYEGIRELYFVRIPIKDILKER